MSFVCQGGPVPVHPCGTGACRDGEVMVDFQAHPIWLCLCCAHWAQGPSLRTPKPTQSRTSGGSPQPFSPTSLFFGRWLKGGPGNIICEPKSTDETRKLRRRVWNERPVSTTTLGPCPGLASAQSSLPVLFAETVRSARGQHQASRSFKTLGRPSGQGWILLSQHLYHLEVIFNLLGSVPCGKIPLLGEQKNPPCLFQRSRLDGIFFFS